MANYIKIRDLGDYSRDDEGNITGIYSGDYAALSSRPLSEGGLEPIENTRKAPIADIIKTVNLAETKQRAKDADIDPGDLADPGVELPPDMTKVIIGKDEDGNPIIVQDPPLTARNFGSVIKLGGGLTYKADVIPGGGEDGEDAYTYSLGLTPQSDENATTFVVFIGKHPELDVYGNANFPADAAGNALTGDNADFLLTQKLTSTTTQNVSYGDNSWKTAQAQGSVFTDDVNSTRTMVDLSGVYDYLPASATATSTAAPGIARITDAMGTFNGKTKYKAVINPFMSLYSALDWCSNTFDPEQVNIRVYLRDPDLVDKNADYYAVNNITRGLPLSQAHQNYKFKGLMFYSPIVGAPRKYTADIGKLASDNTVVSHYNGGQHQFWYAGTQGVNGFANVHMAVKNISDMPTPGHFSWCRLDGGAWWMNGLIIDLSDPSNAGDISHILVAYEDATINVNNDHALLSRMQGLSTQEQITRFTAPGSTQTWPNSVPYAKGTRVLKPSDGTVWDVVANSTNTEPDINNADYTPAPIYYRHNIKDRTGLRFGIEFHSNSNVKPGNILYSNGGGSLIRMFYWSTARFAINNCPVILGPQASIRIMTDAGISANGSFVNLSYGADIYWTSMICKGNTSLQIGAGGVAHGFYFNTVGGMINMAYGPDTTSDKKLISEHQLAVPFDITTATNSNIVNKATTTSDLSSSTLNVMDQSTSQFGAATTLGAAFGTTYSIATPIPTDNLSNLNQACSGTATSLLLGNGLFAGGFAAANDTNNANHTKIFANMNTIGTGNGADEIRALNYELAQGTWGPYVH